MNSQMKNKYNMNPLLTEYRRLDDGKHVISKQSKEVNSQLNIIEPRMIEFMEKNGLSSIPVDDGSYVQITTCKPKRPQLKGDILQSVLNIFCLKEFGVSLSDQHYENFKSIANEVQDKEDYEIKKKIKRKKSRALA